MYACEPYWGARFSKQTRTQDEAVESEQQLEQGGQGKLANASFSDAYPVLNTGSW